MAIRKRKRADGSCAYLVYWVNPLTKGQEGKTFEDHADAKKFDSMMRHQLKYERKSFIEQAKAQRGTDDGSPQRFQALALRYLTEKPMAATTREAATYHLKAFYDTMGNPQLERIDKALMKRFERLCREKGAKQTTIKRKVGIVLAALNWGESEGITPPHNLRGYKCEAGVNEKIKPPTPEEIKRILAAASPLVKRVVVLSYSLGLRVGNSELFRLVWDDFDLEGGTVTIKAAKKNRNVQWREVDLRESIIPTLREWKATDDAQGIPHVINYPRLYRGKPIHNFRRSWLSTLEKAGIDRHLRPYDLRHAFATQALAAGADVGTVSDIMGSSPTMIHKHYQHVLDRQKKAAVESLPDIGV